MHFLTYSVKIYSGTERNETLYGAFATYKKRNFFDPPTLPNDSLLEEMIRFVSEVDFPHLYLNMLFK